MSVYINICIYICIFCLFSDFCCAFSFYLFIYNVFISCIRLFKVYSFFISFLFVSFSNIDLIFYPLIKDLVLLLCFCHVY